MKQTRHLMLLLTAGLFSAGPAGAVRDPFWPIDYVPVAERKTEPPAKQEIEPKPELPKPEPTASEEDWAKARKALSISGVTRSVNPDTHAERTMVMINRQMLSVGDTVSLVYQGFRFKWRVEAIAAKDVKLEPLNAERVAQNNSDLK